jgi:hypothetical protein
MVLGVHQVSGVRNEVEKNFSPEVDQVFTVFFLIIKKSWCNMFIAPPRYTILRLWGPGKAAIVSS